MPFDPELRNVYNTIETVIENDCGLKCIRADEFHHSRRITNDIWRSINESRLLIADLTGRNPNVFYEVGIAHTLNKPVILLAQDPAHDIPFDLREIRYIKYESNNLRTLSQILPQYVSNLISTIPTSWNPDYHPSRWDGAYVKITSLSAPSTVSVGQPFEITLKARNNGKEASQGYFSVSFPSGIDKIEIVEKNTDIQLGLKGDEWGNGKWILDYPIAEGFRYADGEPAWNSGVEYFIKVRAYPNQKGLLRFFANACSRDLESGEWKWDPHNKIMETDQRSENVYCGVVNVV